MEQLSRRLHHFVPLAAGQRDASFRSSGAWVASYREVNSLSPVDAAYIAGLVDGEGTITLSRKHGGEGRQLVLSISNTERPPRPGLHVRRVESTVVEASPPDRAFPSFLYASESRARSRKLRSTNAAQWEIHAGGPNRPATIRSGAPVAARAGPTQLPRQAIIGAATGARPATSRERRGSMRVPLASRPFWPRYSPLLR